MRFPRIKINNRLAERDFIHIDDVARALIVLSQKGRPGCVYNIGSGQATSLDTILERLLAQAGYEDAEILPLSEQLAERSQADISRLTGDTGWRPMVSLEDGLVRELAYWEDEAAVLPVSLMES